MRLREFFGGKNRRVQNGVVMTQEGGVSLEEIKTPGGMEISRLGGKTEGPPEPVKHPNVIKIGEKKRG
jgi:hypothetical protein